MTVRPLLIAAAAGGAAVCGAIAVVSGDTAIAAGAGVLSVLTAALAAPHALGASRHPAPPPVAGPVAGESDEETPVVDPATGLYAPAFLEATLDGRVATARRVLRPLSLVIFEVSVAGDGERTPIDAQTVAATLRATLRESDLACLAGEDTYAMILEDTSEDGAVWTAERVRRNLAASGTTRLFRAGVSSYPNHGLAAAELHVRATHALAMAREWQRDRIEVAEPV